jgi:hypothetical protein
VGFFVGSVIVNVSLSGKLKKGGNLYPGIVANTIMTKRMLAIKEAVKKGKNTYEFEISGLHPILGKN